MYGFYGCGYGLAHHGFYGGYYGCGARYFC